MREPGRNSPCCHRERHLAHWTVPPMGSVSLPAASALPRGSLPLQTPHCRPRPRRTEPGPLKPERPKPASFSSFSLPRTSMTVDGSHHFATPCGVNRSDSIRSDPFVPSGNPPTLVHRWTPQVAVPTHHGLNPPTRRSIPEPRRAHARERSNVLSALSDVPCRSRALPPGDGPTNQRPVRSTSASNSPSGFAKASR